MKTKILSLILISFVSLALIGCKKDTTNVIQTTKSKKATTIVTTQEERFEPKTIVSSDKAYIYAAPNTVAIMQDVDVDIQCEYWGTEWLENTDTLYFQGIKGETESAQLMLTAKENITSFLYKVDSLVNEETEYSIPVENVEILAEKYIEVKATSSKPKKACQFTGFYPDALVPINQYKVRKENCVSKNNNQGIWININIPENADSGMYNGTSTLTLDGVKISVPFTLKVYDVTIPEEIHKKSAFDIWPNQIGYGETIFEDEDGNPLNWEQIYYDYLVSKRITPQKLTIANINEAYGDAAAIAARNPKVTGYRLPYRQETINLNGTDTGVCQYSAIVEILTILANKNIELREAGETTIDLFKKAYFYFASIIDEPSGTKYPAVRYCDLQVSNAKKAVMPLLKDYPDLQESLSKLRHVVTTTLNSDLNGDEVTGGVQTWCCQFNNYSSTMLGEIQERINGTTRYPQGEGFWAYSTCDSNNPYPTFQLDDNLMGMRIAPWMCFDYDIECQLFWCVNFYQKQTSSGAVTRDIWSDPRSWISANGDGYLLYPGSRYGLETPISTLRLESYREGTEDYEYLYLIEQYINDINDKTGSSYNAKEVINKITSSLYLKNSLIPTTNIDKFDKKRTMILNLLELLSTDQAKAIEYINNLE